MMVRSSVKRRTFKKHFEKKSTISGISYTPNEMDPMRLRGGGGLALQFSQPKGKENANSGRMNYHNLQLPGVSGPYQVPAKKYDLQSILSGKSDGNLFLSTKDELNLLQIASTKQSLKRDNSTITQEILNSSSKAFLDHDANTEAIINSPKPTKTMSTRNETHSQKYQAHEQVSDSSEDNTSSFGSKLVIHENSNDPQITRLNKSKSTSQKHHDNSTYSPLQNHTETKGLNQSKKLFQITPENHAKTLSQEKPSKVSSENSTRSFKNEKEEKDDDSLQNATKLLKHENKKMHQESHSNVSKSEKQNKVFNKSNFLNSTRPRSHSRVSNLSQSLGAVLMNLTYISPKLANVSSKLAGALFKLVNISTEEEILAPRLANLLLRMTNISSILDQTASNKTTTNIKRTSPELMPKRTKGIKIINLLIKAALSVYKSKKNIIIHHMDKHHQKVLKQFLFTS